MTDATILVASGDANIKTIHIGEMLTIGRNAVNNLVLSDEVVSRNHALIRRESGDYVVVDLGSANGTFLNGQPVSIATKIKSGDEIRMGDTVLQFRYSHSQQTESESAVVDKTTARVFAPVTLSIFVTDIRNYTTLSEQIPSAELSLILADWFDTAGRCIRDHDGTIEQFRGDCVVAYWLSNPDDNSNDYIMPAVETARDLLRKAPIVNEIVSASYPGQSFRIGCGVHMGGAVLGSIGPDARRDLTMLGDSVNVTFRIEALCSVLGKDLLVSEAIKTAIGEVYTCSDMGMHDLKGISEPLRIFAMN